MVQTEVSVIERGDLLEFLERDNALPADMLAVLRTYSTGNQIDAYQALLGTRRIPEVPYRDVIYGTFFSEEATVRAMKNLGKVQGINFERVQTPEETIGHWGKYAIVTKPMRIR